MATEFSRFAGLSKTRARFVLLAFIVAILGGVAISLLGGATDGGAGDRSSDLALYRAIIERMKHGGEYYATVASELRERGYALRPVLNFRLPTLALLLSFLSPLAGLLLLRALTTAVLLAWIIRLRHTGLRWPHALAASAVLFTGVGLALSEAALVWHEVWAGLLVALALAVHTRRTWGISVALGLCAVLVRELALPLPLLMLVLAVRDRRFTEVAAWTGVCIAFAVVMLLHMHFATQQILPSDGTNTWTAFGGWAFILSTARWNLLLLKTPLWIAAIIVPTGVVGLAGWKSATGGRALLVLVVWLIAFLFLGRPDNHYWGLMYAPLLAVGCALAPLSLRALLRASLLLPVGPATPSLEAAPR